MYEEVAALLKSKRLIGGRYVPLRVLGEGGMGWVLQVEDSMLRGESAVLKFLYPHLVSDQRALNRFKGEVLLARTLIHPGIVRTYNFCADPTFGYSIVMEYVPGLTLRSELDNHNGSGLPIELVLRRLSGILRALSHAHKLGVIHLDVKPENALLSDAIPDAVSQVKLADFGLAQSLRRSGESGRKMLGTPPYMAPEQFAGSLLTEASDVYSIGILAFELLTGRPPFLDTTLFNLAQRHLHDPLPSLGAIRPDTPVWLQAAIAKACEKDSSKRFRNAEQMLSVFREFDRSDSAVPEFITGTREAVLPEVLFSGRSQRSRFRTVLSNRWVRACLVSVALFVATNAARKLNWLHRWVVYSTVRAEQSLGVELNLVRQIFDVRSRFHESLTEISSEPGALKAFLDLGSDPNRMDPISGRLPLVVHTLSYTDVETIAALLRAGANPNLLERSGSAAIHSLGKLPDLRIAEALIAAGGNLNLRDVSGATPLLLAVRDDNLELVRLFLASGADPSIPDKAGVTPLAAAKNRGFRRMLDLLEIAENTKVPVPRND